MARKFKMVAQVVEVPLHLVDNASYNPPRRSNETTKKIQSLAESIRIYGQLVPVHLFWNADKSRLVTSEGHGRVAARRSLSHEFVNAIVSDTAPPGDFAKIYAQINEEVGKHSQADKLFSFLKEEEAVGEWFRTRFTSMIDVIGRDTAEKMVVKDKGYSFYRNRALAIAKWVELHPSQYRDFTNYLLDVTDAETNCRKLKENNGLSGNHTQEARQLEIRKAFEQHRTPSTNFPGNRFEVNSRVAVN